MFIDPKRVFALPLTLAVLSIAAMPLRAAVLGIPLPVYVEFQTTPDTVDEKKSITSELVNALEKSHGAWTYLPVEHPEDAPRLVVWLEEIEGQGFNLRMKLQARFPIPTPVEWTTKLLDPLELATKHLPMHHFTPAIKEKFSDGLLGEQHEKIQKALQEYAPICAGTEIVRNRGNEGYSGIPLKWDKYNHLASSRFKIQSLLVPTGLVLLHSQGTGQPYLMPNNFEAITIQHHQWEAGGKGDDVQNHLNDLPKLQFDWVFLEELKYWIPPERPPVTQPAVTTQPAPQQPTIPLNIAQ